MRGRVITLAALLAGLFAVAIPALALQPTELEEIGPTELVSDDTGGRAEISVAVRAGEFEARWLDVQRSTSRHGGTVVSATVDTVERDGRTVAFGVAELRVPPSGFTPLLSEILSSGRLIDGSLEGNDAAVSEITVTLTESPEIPVDGGVVDDESRLGRALDTAGDVVLTILSVVIVGGAAVIPVAILAGLGYAAWRWTQTRFDRPVEVTRHPDGRTNELIDS